jgi:hypothetical protein
VDPIGSARFACVVAAPRLFVRRGERLGRDRRGAHSRGMPAPRRCASYGERGHASRVELLGWAEPLGACRGLARMLPRRVWARGFVEADSARFEEAFAEEPGRGIEDRHLFVFFAERPRSRSERRRAALHVEATPAVKPGAGGAWIRAARNGADRVLAEVGEHVDEGVPHFARGLEGAPVLAVRPD